MKRKDVISITVPGSKSVTQRALVAAALAPGRSLLTGALACDDSARLTEGLRRLGVRIEWEKDRVVVHGKTKLAAPDEPLMLGNAGTAVRFTSALALLADGPVIIDGVEAMRRRPMPGLVAALRALGAQVEELGAPACPPLRISPPNRTAKHVSLDPSGSSQQLSALLLAAPALGGLQVQLMGPLPSAPYVDLTIEVMEAFGATVQQASQPSYRVEPGGYRATRFQVEADHSSASYPLAAGWLTGKTVTIENLRSDSLQPDRVFAELLARLDQPGYLDLNLEASPDIAPTVAVCALFRRDPTDLTGLTHLRIKECDRLEVLANGLKSLGADITVQQDGWSIRPAPLQGPATLDSASDHRMAMCFGLVGLKVPGIHITDPDCVTKSYPDFWHMLDRFRPSRGSARLSEKKPEHVVLIGLRGSGKTTVGKQLASIRGCDFVDTDDLVGKKLGRTIPEIFETLGKEAFRNAERDVIKDLERLDRPTVIATGGGVVLDPENRRVLQNLGLVIFLDVSTSLAAQRIADSDRPSLTGRPITEEIEALAEARRPLYEKAAHLSIDADNPVEDLVAMLADIRKKG